MKRLYLYLSLLLAITAIGSAVERHPANFIPNGGRGPESTLSSSLMQSDAVNEPSRHASIGQNISEKRVPASAAINYAEEGDLVTVTCTLEDDHEMPTFYIFNSDFFITTDYDVWEQSDDLHTYYFKVPKGVYDIAVRYWLDEDETIAPACIIHEDIAVDSDIIQTFNPSELIHFAFRPMLRNGDEAKLRINLGWDEETQTPVYDDNGANAENIQLSYKLHKQDYPCLLNGNFARESARSESKGENVFVFNRLSDKYHLSFFTMVKLLDGKEVDCSVTDFTEFNEKNEICTYNENCVLFDFPAFSKTPLYYEEGILKYHTGVSARMWIDDVQIGGAGVYIESEEPQIYMAVQPVDSYFTLKGVVLPEGMQMDKNIHRVIDWFGDIWEFDEPVREGILGKPAYHDGEKWVYVNANHADSHNWSYQATESGEAAPEFPGHPAYGYSSDEITGELGNSAPIFVLLTQRNTYSGVPYFWMSPETYLGRYGELRDCDFWNLHYEISLNGEKSFDSDEGINLNDWCYQMSLDGHEKGDFDAIFINRNVLVDNEIEGFNISKIHFDERNDDIFVPNMQMLMFKNKEGEITDRFTSPSDGIIEFSAGDFNWNQTEDNHFYYSCDEAEISVEYAPYGSEEFSELDVIEDPELYFMPGFGHFYSGSLESVDRKSANGWYDLRFTLTDAAGNTMTQHISPGFKIDSLTGIDKIVADGLIIRNDNGKIRTEDGQPRRMAAFSADGKLLAETYSSVLDLSNASGVVFVRIADEAGASATSKFILK